MEHWHEMIGDATFGDAILDRLVHHAQRRTLTGGSLRRLAPTTTSPAPHADYRSHGRTHPMITWMRAVARYRLYK